MLSRMDIVKIQQAIDHGEVGTANMIIAQALERDQEQAQLNAISYLASDRDSLIM